MLLKFEEFIKKDQENFNAFSEFISVSRAKEEGVIPKEYNSIFDNDCKCGSEMMIQRNRKKLMCCDPRCRIKIGLRLAETFKRFECDNLGPGTSSSIINQTWEYLKYKSHIEALLMPEESFPMVLTGAKSLDFKYAIERIKGTKITLASFISKLALPKMEDKAIDIFENYKMVDEFVNDYKAHGGLVRLLALKGIRDLKVAYYIDECLPDLYLGEMLIEGKVKDTALVNTYVCLTGRLKLDGLPITKQNYIAYLNEESIAKDGKVIYEFIPCSAKESVPYIIYTNPSADDKYLVGVAREKEYLQGTGEHKQILIKPEELLEKVRKVVKEYEHRLD